jgi:hypothetical protein
MTVRDAAPQQGPAGAGRHEDVSPDTQSRRALLARIADTTMVLGNEVLGADDVVEYTPSAVIPFDLAQYLTQDEHGHDVWRFDDSRAWGRGPRWPSGHAIVAHRHPPHGRNHLTIGRTFHFDELPHLIAFLLSVYDELDEPPF